MPAVTTTTDPLADTRTKLLGLIDTVDAELVNRYDTIEVCVLALLSRSHVFLLGPPGTGKTATIDRVVRRIAGANQFSILLGKGMPLEKLVGPLSLQALKDDRYLHRHEHYLPWAHVAKLDEVWKASTALLNELLEMLNERRTTNDGVVVDIPLCSVFGASNELPQEETESLGAIYDRFLFRLDVEPLTDAADIETMLRRSLAAPPVPVPVITWGDVCAAQAAVAAMPVGDAAIAALIEILVGLRKIGVSPSNRRQAECLRVIQAAAWLAGATEADASHLEALVHVFFEKPESARAVEKVVLEVASPKRKEAIALADAVGALSDEFNTLMKLKPEERFGGVHELNGKLGAAATECDTLAETASGRAARTLAETAAQIQALTEAVLDKGFNFGAKKARNMARSMARRNGNGGT